MGDQTPNPLVLGDWLSSLCMHIACQHIKLSLLSLLSLLSMFVGPISAMDLRPYTGPDAQVFDKRAQLAAGLAIQRDHLAGAWTRVVNRPRELDDKAFFVLEQAALVAAGAERSATMARALPIAQDLVKRTKKSQPALLHALALLADRQHNGPIFQEAIEAVTPDTMALEPGQAFYLLSTRYAWNVSPARRGNGKSVILCDAYIGRITQALTQLLSSSTYAAAPRYALQTLFLMRPSVSASHGLFLRENVVAASATLAVDPWYAAIQSAILANHVAWSARGDDVGSKVSDEGWRYFRSELPKAVKFYEKAYALRPKDPWAASELVALHFTTEHVPEFEVWLGRSIYANLEAGHVAQRVVHFMRPRWGKSYEELLDFGIACQLTGRADTTLGEVLPLCMITWAGDRTHPMGNKDPIQNAAEVVKAIDSYVAVPAFTPRILTRLTATGAVLFDQVHDLPDSRTSVAACMYFMVGASGSAASLAKELGRDRFDHQRANDFLLTYEAVCGLPVDKKKPKQPAKPKPSAPVDPGF